MASHWSSCCLYCAVVQMLMPTLRLCRLGRCVKSLRKDLSKSFCGARTCVFQSISFLKLTLWTIIAVSLHVFLMPARNRSLTKWRAKIHKNCFISLPNDMVSALVGGAALSLGNDVILEKVPHKSVMFAQKVPHKNVILMINLLSFSILFAKRYEVGWICNFAC